MWWRHPFSWSKVVKLQHFARPGGCTINYVGDLLATMPCYWSQKTCICLMRQMMQDISPQIFGRLIIVSKKDLEMILPLDAFNELSPTRLSLAYLLFLCCVKV